MLKSDTLKKERRLLSQPASHSRNQFYISIRTLSGDSITLEQNFKMAIDNVLMSCILFAIKLMAASKMCKDAIFQKMKRHIQNHSRTGDIWFSGVRKIPRIHQWDERELLFPTYAWIDFKADSPVEANLALEKLIATGLAWRHGRDIVSTATHVFAYASNRD